MKQTIAFLVLCVVAMMVAAVVASYDSNDILTRADSAIAECNRQTAEIKNSTARLLELQSEVAAMRIEVAAMQAVADSMKGSN